MIQRRDARTESENLLDASFHLLSEPSFSPELFISSLARLAIACTDTNIEEVLEQLAGIPDSDSSGHPMQPLREKFGRRELPCGIVLCIWTESERTFVALKGEPLGEFMLFREGKF